MEILHSTSRARETYQVEIKHSLLWEAALGIAAVTNKPLYSTLEKTERDWRVMKEKMSSRTLEELDYVEKHNTWKTLLQLLHDHDFDELTEYINYIKQCPEDELKFIAIPFLGEKSQGIRESAARGKPKAIKELQRMTEGNPFIPSYIDFIATVDINKLKAHLIRVMEEWYKSQIKPSQEKLKEILQRDAESKQSMYESLHPEKLVEWATGGVHYHPEPSVHKVLLIPHYIYRPWNIEADLEGTKVFYYPIANESLDPEDRYMPSYSLIQKHKALGDETRLRMVKLLSDKDWTLQELTEHLNMGKSTIHHHLKILKSAKIVDSIQSVYRLRRSSLEALPLELMNFIKHV